MNQDRRTLCQRISDLRPDAPLGGTGTETRGSIAWPAPLERLNHLWPDSMVPLPAGKLGFPAIEAKSFADGRWGQGSPKGDERSEHALETAERRRDRARGPPSTRIRCGFSPQGHWQREPERPVPPGSLTRSVRSAAIRATLSISGGAQRRPMHAVVMRPLGRLCHQISTRLPSAIRVSASCSESTLRPNSFASNCLNDPVIADNVACARLRDP